MLTWHIYSEAVQARYSDHICAVDCSVEGIHGESGRAVHNEVSGLQDTSHEQIYKLVGPTSHLQTQLFSPAAGFVTVRNTSKALRSDTGVKREPKKYQKILCRDVVGLCQGSS